jgi:hypothetical protein
MVGLDGVEPSTSRLSGVRSNRAELQAQTACEVQIADNRLYLPQSNSRIPDRSDRANQSYYAYIMHL